MIGSALHHAANSNSGKAPSGRPVRILRLTEVKSLTGLSRSTLYDRMKTGSFPNTIPLGGRLVGWLESDVGTWIEARVTARHQER